MPIKGVPPVAGVYVDWTGDIFNRRVQSSLRRALSRAGQIAVEEMRAEDSGGNRDTEAMINSAQAKVPRRSPGSTTYRLLIGVFPGESAEGTFAPGEGHAGAPGNTREGEKAEEYAFWQEIGPNGKPFIRPAADNAGGNILDFLREELTYRSGVLGYNPDEADTNVDDNFGRASATYINPGRDE